MEQSTQDVRDRIEEMLKQRGVTEVVALMTNVPDTDLDGVLGAIAMYDDMPQTGPRAVTPGLLVKKIRDGGVPGYRRPHERTSPEGETSLLPDHLKRVRRICLSPDGFTRDDGRHMFAGLARKLNTRVDALLDTAVTPEWRETPPHPAYPTGWTGDHIYPAKERPLATARYFYVVASRDELRMRADTSVRRNPGEISWSFSLRFWGWQDPAGLKEVVGKLERARQEREKAFGARFHETLADMREHPYEPTANVVADAVAENAEQTLMLDDPGPEQKPPPDNEETLSKPAPDARDRQPKKFCRTCEGEVVDGTCDCNRESAPERRPTSSEARAEAGPAGETPEEREKRLDDTFGEDPPFDEEPWD